MSPAAPHLLLIDQDPADRSRTAAAVMALFPLTRLREVELGADFFDALKGSAFDVVVTEMATRWASWPFLLGAIRALQPDATIVVYTRETDPASRRDALAAGAQACVVKSERGLLDLTQAIDRIMTTPEASFDDPASRPPGADPDDDRRVPGPAPGSRKALQEGTADDRAGAAVREPLARGTGTAIAEWTRSLRDREAGGPLAILAGVIALTALLTVLVAGPSHDETDPRGDRATGLVAGETIEAPAEDPATPTPTRAEPRSDAPAVRSSPRPVRPTPRTLASDAPLAIELHPRDEVWVRLFLDGEKVLETTLRPGQNRFFEGREIADLTIGNAAALTVFWNGTDLGNLGSEGQVRRLNLSPTRVGTGPAPSPG